MQVSLTVAAWAGWSVEEGFSASAADDGSHPVPAMLRRRLSEIGSNALRAAGLAGGAAGARFVFCSRHGEYARTARILKGIVAGEPVSPADFSMAVHNALSGVLSIACKNTQPHTAIAAGPDSFGFGLLEAAAQLAENPEAPVLLVYWDEPLPDEYGCFNEDGAAALALALLLKSGSDVTMALRPSAPAPEDQARRFVDFLRSGRSQAVAGGERFAFEWRRR